MSIRIENDDTNKKHIIFSEVYDLGPVDVKYDGNVSGAPLLITFMALKGDVYNPELYNSNTREFIKIDTNKIIFNESPIIKMVIGDKIVINTEKGNKSCKFIRGTTEIDIFDAMTNDSTWLTIEPGLNQFNYSTVDPDGITPTYLNLQITLEADKLYIGA